MRNAGIMLVLVSGSLSGSGCNESGSAPAPGAAPAPSAPAPAAPMAAAPAPSADAPLSCDEDRFQKWLAYKKESMQTLAAGLQGTAKQVEADKQGTSRLAGLAVTGHALEAVQAKYGFARNELSRLEQLSGAVSSSRQLDNPMMKGTVDMMRGMAKGSGPMKESADKFFKGEEEKQKKAEASARQKFGDACVDVFLKHISDINAMQMAGVQAVFGGPKPAK